MANNVKRFKKTNRNAKHFKNNEKGVITMLQTILDFILFIPRKIYYHFEDYKSLKAENKQLETIITNQQRLFKRIISECDYNMTVNNYNSYEGYRKIKRLAQTFPNDN